MTDWTALRDVYGSAAGISALVRDAASATEWDAPAWRALWERLYHQGTVAPASYAALPALAHIAEARADLSSDPAIYLAASIIASNDGPPEIDGVRSAYAAEIAALQPVAEHKLDLVEDRADVLYALEVLAAFEDLSPWQRNLDRLVDLEIEVTCPSCGGHVCLESVDGALVATPDPDDVRGGQRVLQAHPSDLNDVEARLLTVCQAHGHRAVATELLQVFGQAPCPHCGARFSIATGLA